MINFTVKDRRIKEESKNLVTFSLNARRTIDNNVMIFDHKEIDIVLMTNKNKVVTFAKDELNEEVYLAQDRLFKFLCDKGVIDFNSVQGGNIYSSMEANILESTEVNPYDTTLLMINKFIKEEQPYYEFEKAWDEAEEQRLTDPDPDESTDWDPEKYHRVKKGSMPRSGKAGYGISSIYRL